MPTLGTQNISTSYPQLLKTFGTGGLDGTLQVVTDGDNTSSALSVSTSGVASTGSLEVVGTSLLTGAVTFGTSFTASTGTATIGAAVIGATTFTTGFTSSTGTNTLGTIASTTFTNTGVGTTGTLQVGASGPKLTAVSYGTFAFSGGTVQTHANNDTTTGTFALPCQLGDIVIGSINSLGSTTGTGALIATSFFPIATDVVEYNIIGKGTTAGTIPAGTIFATALRFTV
jgi:hypothetical protein